MRIHYLPQFLLKNFRDDCSLFELDKENAKCSPRSVESAAQVEDLWPVGIEHGVMQTMDNRAAKILQNRVFGRAVINLSSAERERLCSWFSLLMFRVPKYQRRMFSNSQLFGERPDALAMLLTQIGHAAARKYLKDHPDEMERRVAIYGTEELAVLSQLVRWFFVAQAASDIKLSGSFLFERCLTHHATTLAADKFLCMDWHWVTCPSVDFVIGDNPVFIRHLSEERGDYGYRLPSAEVVIPLSRKVSLVMRHGCVSRGEVTTILEPEAVSLNRKQIESALRFVYGSSGRILRPDDEAAQYGF